MDNRKLPAPTGSRTLRYGKRQKLFTKNAGRPENKAIFERLDKALKELMKSCGNEGQTTEMKVQKHQFRITEGKIGG